jgi:hypothetical protein
VRLRVRALVMTGAFSRLALPSCSYPHRRWRGRAIICCHRRAASARSAGVLSTLHSHVSNSPFHAFACQRLIRRRAAAAQTLLYVWRCVLSRRLLLQVLVHIHMRGYGHQRILAAKQFLHTLADEACASSRRSSQEEGGRAAATTGSNMHRHTQYPMFFVAL